MESRYKLDVENCHKCGKKGKRQLLTWGIAGSAGFRKGLQYYIKCLNFKEHRGPSQSTKGKAAKAWDKMQGGT